MYIAIGIILLAAALFLIVAVLLQSGKSQGLSGSISGGNSSETYFGKNKGKSREKKLNTLTIIVAIVFVLIVLGVFLSQDYVSIWGTTTTTTTGSATVTTTSSL